MSTTFSRDFLIEVAKGNISGHSLVHKFGKNDAVGGTFEHISLLPFSTANFRQSAVAMRVKAGDAADDTGGNGAREITIQGIDSNFAETSAAIATAGTSASSNFAGTWWRVHRAWVSAAGTYTAANTAAVVIEDSGAAADFITIAIEEGQSQYAGFTIPAGKTGYLLSVHAAVSVGTNKECDIQCLTRKNIDDVSAPMNAVRLKLYWSGIQEAFNYKPNSPELSLPEKTDIWFEAKATASSQISLDFELLLVDN